MSSTVSTLIDFGIIAIFLVGVGFFRTVKLARWGNQLAALALGLAVLVVFLRHDLNALPLLIAAGLIGSAVGWAVAVRVSMIQIPAMVAFQHGAGGVAAFLVSTVEILRASEVGWTVGRVSGILGIALGAATFSASLIASGKLSGKLGQRPTVLPHHSPILWALVAPLLLVMALVGSFDAATASWGAPVIIVLSVSLGVLVAIRVGGADMPVLISFLNATAGLAAAFCGVIIQNRLLVACGATVAASGSVLTIIMCRAMNRGLGSVFVGVKAQVSGAAALAPGIPMALLKEALGELASEGSSDQAGTVEQELTTEEPRDPRERALEMLEQAKSVIIVPGYGMALAQAQFKVVQLGERLKERGASVSYAIHPVAGRMPGHMNVLLAEADVSYEDLKEMEEINPHFLETDLALVVGACDVVNPAASELKDTSISGMPILLVQDARHVIVCNLDDKPGYSGVDNLLYNRSNVCLLLGDAGATMKDLLAALA